MKANQTLLRMMYVFFVMYDRYVSLMHCYQTQQDTLLLTVLVYCHTIPLSYYNSYVNVTIHSRKVIPMANA